ncbi:MAG: hypothetical protein Q9164_002704 [Protoblastenia rupestris]
MGNLCGKPSKDTDPFAQPGRTLGPAPPQPSNPRASVPKISGGTGSQGKTLGGDTSAEQSDARSAAAKAAEERAAKASKPTGKLGRDLASQKAQTRNETLDSVSKDERRRRDADQVGDVRNYN